ncbi:MAG: polysaccharide pyruvyl transferase family protein [Spirochaetota bacterium]|nr:polysaccharide pyruvyl transferase family protein [Spirochaetota bacterium]
MLIKKVVLTGASLSNENKGINALTLGSIIALIENNPGIEIELINQNYIHDKIIKHKINIKGNEIEIIENFIWTSKFILCAFLHMLFPFLPLKLKQFLFIDNLFIFYYFFMKLKRKTLMMNNPTIKKLITADYVISLAEGDSFSDIYGIYVFLRQSLDKVLALIYKRPVIIFPQTIGPFNSFISNRITKKIVKGTKKIYVRENQSKNHLINLFGDLPNMEEANDMAFLMQPDDVKNEEFESFIQIGIPVGINVSGFLYNNPIGMDKIKREDFDYAYITERIIDTLLNIDSKIKIVFISHVGIEDFSVSKILFERYTARGYKDRLFLLDDCYSASQLKFFLSRLEFFTGARMHSCIGAFSTCIPTVPQAYSYKFIGITEKLKLGEYVVNLKNDSLENILEIIKRGFNNRQDIRKHLIKIIPEIKKESLKCGKIE